MLTSRIGHVRLLIELLAVMGSWAHVACLLGRVSGKMLLRQRSVVIVDWSGEIHPLFFGRYLHRKMKFFNTSL